MGKKIPKSNRHKKLKAVDPFYSGDRKLLIDKGLISANQAPKDLDNVKIPVKLRELLELKSKIEKTKGKKKNQKRLIQTALEKKADESGAENPLRSNKKLKKLQNESDETYLKRLDKEVETVINRSQYETQFGVKLETKDDQVVVVKEKKMSERKRRALNKLKDKLKQKKLNIKLEKENKKLKDVVRFGEVVDQPPEFSTFPKFSKHRNITGRNPTIPANAETKNGITEKDRTDVIQRYRIMKKQGKFT